MIDPQAKLVPYLKLLALVVLIGLMSALLTFAFVVLVNQGTSLIWDELAAMSGLDPRLFTILICTLGGLVVGLLVKHFGDHNAIFADLMLEFGKNGRFNYCHAPVVSAVYALSAPSALGTYLSGAGPVLVKLQCRVRLLPYRRYYLTGVWRNWQPPLDRNAI